MFLCLWYITFTTWFRPIVCLLVHQGDVDMYKWVRHIHLGCQIVFSSFFLFFHFSPNCHSSCVWHARPWHSFALSECCVSLCYLWIWTQNYVFVLGRLKMQALSNAIPSKWRTKSHLWKLQDLEYDGPNRSPGICKTWKMTDQIAWAGKCMTKSINFEINLWITTAVFTYIELHWWKMYLMLNFYTIFSAFM